MAATNEEIDSLISKTQAFSWQDLQLVPEMSTAKQFSELSSVGKLLSSKPLNKNTFHVTIKAVWSFVLGLKIEDMELNTFLFTFPSQQDKKRVLVNRPWNFKGFHMVLKEWLPGLSIHEVQLNTSVFWVQVHGLPLEMLTNQNAEHIGKVLGNLIEVDKASIFGVALRRYLRVKVEMNIEKPLPDGFDLERPGRIAKKILLKYERLSDFCYGCGLLGHIVQACPYHVEIPVQSKYGPWMRAKSSNFRCQPRQIMEAQEAILEIPNVQPQLPVALVAPTNPGDGNNILNMQGARQSWKPSVTRTSMPPVSFKDPSVTMAQTYASTKKTFFSKGKGKMFVKKVNCYSKLQNSGNTINIFAELPSEESWLSKAKGKSSLLSEMQPNQAEFVGREHEQWADFFPANPLNSAGPFKSSDIVPISSLPQEIRGQSAYFPQPLSSHLLSSGVRPLFPGRISSKSFLKSNSLEPISQFGKKPTKRTSSYPSVYQNILKTFDTLQGPTFYENNPDKWAQTKKPGPKQCTQSNPHQNISESENHHKNDLVNPVSPNLDHLCILNVSFSSQNQIQTKTPAENKIQPNPSSTIVYPLSKKSSTPETLSVTEPNSSKEITRKVNKRGLEHSDVEIPPKKRSLAFRPMVSCPKIQEEIGDIEDAD